MAIFTGAGRGFCAGEDMKESLQDGAPGGRRPARPDPFMEGTLDKPVIAAVNGFAMGGGFMLVERTDQGRDTGRFVRRFRKPSVGCSAATITGIWRNLPYPIAMEMAMGFRFTAERFHELGFVNRLVDDIEDLLPGSA